jgi:hypothetical protein
MRTELRGEKLEIRNSLVHNSVINYLIYFLTFISITTVTMFLYSMCSTKPLFHHLSQILMFLDKKQWKLFSHSSGTASLFHTHFKTGQKDGKC